MEESREEIDEIIDNLGEIDENKSINESNLDLKSEELAYDRNENENKSDGDDEVVVSSAQSENIAYRKGSHKDFKTGMTPKQTKFAEVYMATGDGSKAIREAYGEVKHPAQMAYALKQKGEIMNYIQMNAQRAAEIQVEMMESKRTPAQVRYNITKDMLDRAGIGKEDEKDEGNQFSIGNIIIKVEK